MQIPPPAKYDELLRIFGAPDAPTPSAGDFSDSADLTATLNDYFASREATLAVFGVDIYGYSRFPPGPQRLVPVAFRWILESAARLAKSSEPFLFTEYDLKGHFIPTGDGGFLIFNTPLHALSFAAYFQAVVEGYNSGFYYPQLLNAIGPLTLRYSLTYDSVSNLDDNWFGSAIISNARVMARDTLNRFLIDAATVRWFAARIGTVESLVAVVAKSLPQLIGAPKDTNATSLLFSSSEPDLYNPNAFKSIHVQKVGVVTSKASEIDLYNFYMQVRLVHKRIVPYVERPVVITVGNLNTAGITA